MTALNLGLAVVALLGNAFFVGAEFALISARRSQIEPLTAGSRRARIVLDNMRHLSLLLACSQLGITVCSLGLGAVAEPAVAHLLEDGFDAVGLPGWLLHPVAFAIALAIVASLHMVLGEMVPKNLALALPERAALLLGPPMAMVVRAARPLIWLLNRLANAVLRLFRVEPRDELAAAYTADEIAGLLAESRAEGLLEPVEHELLASALALAERTAAAVILPLDELVTVPETITADRLEDLVARTGYSRYPVRRGSDNDPTDPLIGFVHAKDTLGLSPADRRRPVPPQRMRRLSPIPIETPLSEVLAALQRAGSHLGAVVDRSGATLGVIALEDVVEEFVGEVDDASHRFADQSLARHDERR